MNAQGAMVAIEVSRRPGLKRGLSRIGIKIDLKARILQREISTRYWRQTTRHDTFSNPSLESLSGATPRFRSLPEADLAALLAEHHEFVSRLAIPQGGRIVTADGD